MKPLVTFEYDGSVLVIVVHRAGHSVRLARSVALLAARREESALFHELDRELPALEADLAKTGLREIRRISGRIRPRYPIHALRRLADAVRRRAPAEFAVELAAIDRANNERN